MSKKIFFSKIANQLKYINLNIIWIFGTFLVILNYEYWRKYKMKYYIVIFLVVFSVAAFSQSASNSEDSKEKNLESKTKITKTDSKKQSMKNTECDVNGEKKGLGKNKSKMMIDNKSNKDWFIDEDGDGINDNQCRGMGVGRCSGKGKCGNKKVK
jgi:hypothetical protein